MKNTSMFRQQKDHLKGLKCYFWMVYGILSFPFKKECGIAVSTSSQDDLFMRN